MTKNQCTLTAFTSITVIMYGGNPHAYCFQNTESELLHGLQVNLVCFSFNCVSAYLYAKFMHWNSLLSDESMDTCAALSFVFSLLI